MIDFFSYPETEKFRRPVIKHLFSKDYGFTDSLHANIKDVKLISDIFKALKLETGYTLDKTKEMYLYFGDKEVSPTDTTVIMIDGSFFKQKGESSKYSFIASFFLTGEFDHIALT